MVSEFTYLIEWPGQQIDKVNRRKCLTECRCVYATMKRACAETMIFNTFESKFKSTFESPFETTFDGTEVKEKHNYDLFRKVPKK